MQRFFQVWTMVALAMVLVGCSGESLKIETPPVDPNDTATVTSKSMATPPQGQPNKLPASAIRESVPLSKPPQ